MSGSDADRTRLYVYKTQYANIAVSYPIILGFDHWLLPYMFNGCEHGTQWNWVSITQLWRILDIKMHIAIVCSAYIYVTTWVCTLQKIDVYDFWNVSVKRFKFCHIFYLEFFIACHFIFPLKECPGLDGKSENKLHMFSYTKNTALIYHQA